MPEPTTGGPYPTFVAGLSVRLSRRRSVFFSGATGRYWATGASHNKWHTDVRLPFLQVGIVRALPDQRERVRVTFLGWRGTDHRPSPGFREWSWPSARGSQDAPA